MNNKLSRSEAGRLGAIQSAATKRLRYESSPKSCVFCNSVFPYEQKHKKFCNQSCAASFNNKGVCRHGISAKEGEHACLGCNQVINRKNSKFCSNKCQQNYAWELRKKKIVEAGEEDQAPVAKRFLIETRGHKCEDPLCQLTEWYNRPIPLTLDHINGDAENNKLTNLRLICPNCDTFTPTYKSKNRGNGRAWRRQRYKEGKSY